MEEHYIQEFRREYYSLGKYHLQSQAPHLARLADDYSQRYTRSGHWTDCLKSHALYNSCGARMPDKADWAVKAYMLQKQLLGENYTTTFEDNRDLVESLREELHTIRKEFNQKIEEPKSLALHIPTECNNIKSYPIPEFTEKMITVSLDCTNKMTMFARKIMSNSMESLKTEPPCPFSVVVIGSMARGEATPYSDLEYMFLIKEKSTDTLSYFHDLAMTSYFLIGNLRETKLSYIDIEELHDWFDDCAMNGFKIDGLSAGAGNIPTGRGTPETENKFIVTPEELLLRYQEVFQNPDPEESKRGDFTAMLLYMRSVYFFGEGAEKLLPELKSHMECLNQTEGREEANFGMMRNDMTKFNFKPSESILSRGYTINVKREIFRFPSIIILDLAILHRKCSSSTWETLTALANSRLIASSAKEKLEFLLASACFIRLAAYLYYDTHDDRMSVALRNEDVHSNPNQAILRLSRPTVSPSASQRRWFVPLDLYYMMCRTMIPLKDQLLKSNNLKTFGKTEDENNSELWINELRIFIYSGRKWSDTMRFLTRRFEEEIKTDARKCLDGVICDPKLLADIGFVLLVASCLGSAAQLYQKLYDDRWLGEDHLMAYGWVLYFLNRIEEAHKVVNTLPTKPAGAYEFLGIVYEIQGMFEEAEKCFVTSLDMYCRETSQDKRYDYYGQQIKTEVKNRHLDLLLMNPMERPKWVPYPDPRIIKVLRLLGNMYTKCGMSLEAISHCHKALHLTHDFFGAETVTNELIGVCNTLSIAYKSNSEPEKALDYSRQGLSMFRQIYTKPTMEYAAMLNNTGYHCIGLKKHFEAYCYIRQCIGMLKSLSLQDTLHMAHSLDSLGEYYAETCQFTKSEHTYREAQAIFRNHHPNHTGVDKINRVLSQLRDKQAHALQFPIRCRYPI